MPKCPVCGYMIAASNQNNPSELHCPVIGCDGIIEMTIRPNATRMWQKPKNASLDWAKKGTSSHPSDNKPSNT